MKPTCRTFRSAFLLADGAGPADPHLTACEDCGAFVQLEQRTKSALHTNAPRWPASVDLHERVAAVLERERRLASAQRGLSRRAVVAAAIASTVVGAAGVWHWSGSRASRRRAATVIDLIVEDFLKYAGAGAEKLQVATADPATVEAFFQSELKLAARVPRLHGAVLLGGRRCSLAGRPAALMFLERHGAAGPTPLSLFVFEPAGEDWAGMEEVASTRAKRVRHRVKRGVGVLAWEERGLVYAMAGAEEIGDLVSVVEGHL